MMVHSHVAVLLPVGEARAMHLSISKTDYRKMYTRRSNRCKPSMSHKIDRLDLGSAFVRSAKNARSNNNIPDLTAKSDAHNKLSKEGLATV